MVAFPTQIAAIVPETFVKIIMNTGRSKYGFIIESEIINEQVVLVSMKSIGSNFPMNIETIDMDNIVSIDQFVR